MVVLMLAIRVRSQPSNPTPSASSAAAIPRPTTIDLIHQRIEVANFDWNATAFDGNVTTTVVSLQPGLDSIVLNMGRRLASERRV